jgi:putative ABC transport system permease protein
MSAISGRDTIRAQTQVLELLRQRKRTKEGDADDPQVRDMTEFAEVAQETSRTMTLLLAGIAAVSLIVGGIGIMNIMLVSVTERTREIGIRLAIGAVGREVLMQFLVEAVVLACLGGLIGLVLALAATFILAPIIQVPFLFDPQINLIAFSVSALIGIVFGYFPARRAAALNPIDALRHE